jgi:hypothetical protein
MLVIVLHGVLIAVKIVFTDNETMNENCYIPVYADNIYSVP